MKNGNIVTGRDPTVDKFLFGMTRYDDVPQLQPYVAALESILHEQGFTTYRYEAAGYRSFVLEGKLQDGSTRAIKIGREKGMQARVASRVLLQSEKEIPASAAQSEWATHILPYGEEIHSFADTTEAVVNLFNEACDPRAKGHWSYSDFSPDNMRRIDGKIMIVDPDGFTPITDALEVWRCYAGAITNIKNAYSPPELAQPIHFSQGEMRLLQRPTPDEAMPQKGIYRIGSLEIRPNPSSLLETNLKSLLAGQTVSSTSLHAPRKVRTIS